MIKITNDIQRELVSFNDMMSDIDHLFKQEEEDIWIFIPIVESKCLMVCKSSVRCFTMKEMIEKGWSNTKFYLASATITLSND